MVLYIPLYQGGPREMVPLTRSMRSFFLAGHARWIIHIIMKARALSHEDQQFLHTLKEWCDLQPKAVASQPIALKRKDYPASATHSITGGEMRAPAPRNVKPKTAPLLATGSLSAAPLAAGSHPVDCNCKRYCTRYFMEMPIFGGQDFRYVSPRYTILNIDEVKDGPEEHILPQVPSCDTYYVYVTRSVLSTFCDVCSC